MTLKSPCVDACAINARTGWCAGCGRTVEEITSWRKMTPYRQRIVLADLPRRVLRLRSGASGFNHTDGEGHVL